MLFLYYSFLAISKKLLLFSLSLEKLPSDLSRIHSQNYLSLIRFLIFPTSLYFETIFFCTLAQYKAFYSFTLFSNASNVLKNTSSQLHASLKRSATRVKELCFITEYRAHKLLSSQIPRALLYLKTGHSRSYA